MNFITLTKQVEHKFLILFPKAFEDANWLKLSKKHDSTRIDNIFKTTLSQPRMQALIAENNTEEIIADILKTVSYSTTISMFEKFAIRNYLGSKSTHKDFLEVLYKFLHEDYKKYFAEFTYTLTKTKNSITNSNCAKWSIVSFFLAFSDKNHVLLKPTTAKTTAKFFEVDIEYQSYPNLETYEKYKELILKFKENSLLVKNQDISIAQAVIFCALSYSTNEL
ncbi:MAG: hypothetical protein LBH40_00615 [Alphaproteobacteria bacterium]|jgi:hypothetical protein|nr:hypothetical protein [Alphaproteobacteria bacterium]